MKKIVNLNQFRKQKARTDASARADQNAVVHGRSKAEKTLDRARADKLRQDHDQSKLDK